MEFETPLLLLPLSLPVKLGEAVEGVCEGDAAPLEEVAGQGLGNGHRSVFRGTVVDLNGLKLVLT